jgi:hypothetical protein
MLAYILAIAVGLASLGLYLSAFFLPELHRKDDFLWSGVGLFYALILWVCAGRMTGGVLLGQSAAVSLVLCFGWQTLRLRRVMAHPEEQTDISGFSLLTWTQNRFQKKSSPVTPTVTEPPGEDTPEDEEKPNLEETPLTSEAEIEAEATTSEETPLTSEAEIEATTFEETPLTSEAEIEATTFEETPLTSEAEIEAEATTSQETPSTITATPETKKEGFSLKSIFGFGKSKPQTSTETPQNLTLNPDLDEEEWEEEKDNNDLSEMEEITPTLVEETEVIKSETVAEKSEEVINITAVNSEESIDQDSSVSEFEPFMADDDAETVIEKYQPKVNIEEFASVNPETDDIKPLEEETTSPEMTNENENQKMENGEDKLDK